MVDNKELESRNKFAALGRTESAVTNIIDILTNNKQLVYATLKEEQEEEPKGDTEPEGEREPMGDEEPPGEEEPVDDEDETELEEDEEPVGEDKEDEFPREDATAARSKQNLSNSSTALDFGYRICSIV